MMGRLTRTGFKTYCVASVFRRKLLSRKALPAKAGSHQSVRFWFVIFIALAGLPAVALPPSLAPESDASFGEPRQSPSGGGGAKAGAAPSASAAPVDLRAAAIVIPRRPADAAAERLAADVLREEIEKRTGFVWTTSDQWPAQGVAVAIAVGSAPEWGASMPVIAMRPEAYRLVSGTREGRPVIWILGADARGALFGVGRLLRTLSWGRGTATLDAAVDVEDAPR
jgi:hypothetical protein